MLTNNLLFRAWSVSSETMHLPLNWPEPSHVKVLADRDLFGADLPLEFVAAVFGVMAACQQHTFHIQTKHPAAMKDFFSWVASGKAPDGKRPDPDGRGHTAMCVFTAGDHLDAARNDGMAWVPRQPFAPWPLPNVWLGVPASNQQEADDRVSWLLTCPAALRFVRCAPLLEKVDLDPGICQMCYWNIPNDFVEAEDGTPCCAECGHEVAFGNWLNSGSLATSADDKGIGWVIAGGMVSDYPVPSHPDWFRSLRDQCVAAEVPFYFEGWGEFVARKLHPEPTQCTADNWGIIDNAGHWYPTATPWNGRQGEDSETREYTMVRVGQKEAGRLLDGRTWEEWPAPRESDEAKG